MFQVHLTRTAAVVVALSLAPALVAARAVPPPGGNIVPFSGKLDKDGVPMTATVPMIFKLYDTVDGDTPIWTEEHPTVEFHRGSFAVLLGSITPLTVPLIDIEEVYIEVTVDGVLLSGRKRLNAAPYAMRSVHAGQADHAITADSATDSANATSATSAGTAGTLSCSHSNYGGLCINHIGGYDKNFRQAATACRNAGMHLCSIAEINQAWAAGYERCSYGWFADRVNDTTGYVGYPMNRVDGNCGSRIGIILEQRAHTSQVGAHCCRAR